MKFKTGTCKNTWTRPTHPNPRSTVSEATGVLAYQMIQTIPQPRRPFTMSSPPGQRRGRRVKQDNGPRNRRQRNGGQGRAVTIFIHILPCKCEQTVPMHCPRIEAWSRGSVWKSVKKRQLQSRPLKKTRDMCTWGKRLLRGTASFEHNGSKRSSNLSCTTR